MRRSALTVAIGSRSATDVSGRSPGRADGPVLQSSPDPAAAEPVDHVGKRPAQADGRLRGSDEERSQRDDEADQEEGPQRDPQEPDDHASKMRQTARASRPITVRFTTCTDC